MTLRTMLVLGGALIIVGNIFTQFVVPWSQILGWALVAAGVAALAVPLVRHLRDIKDDERPDDTPFWG